MMILINQIDSIIGCIKSKAVFRVRDMTEGNVTGHMIRFAIPLMIGNVFQQLYGAVSSIVVGRYLGKEALAAMGTAVPIMNILLFLLVGMTMGASILMAEYFGAKDTARLKSELATSIVAGLVFTVVLSAVAALAIVPALRIINTPEVIIPQAAAYLRIIFAGLAFAFLYNLLSSALRSVGEATMPLVFLVLSSVLNIVLAVLFVGRLGFGVRGAALATVIAEAAAMAACAFYIWARVPDLRLRLWELRPERALLSRTISYSWVSGVQQTFLYVGIFLVQGAVNPLGVDAIAAFNAVSRVDGFILAPSDSLALSLMTFISQNRGAGRNERIREGVGRSLAINVAYTSAVAIGIYFGAHRLMSLFLDAGEVSAIGIGVGYMRVMCAFFIVSAFCNTLQGYFRGMGLMRIALYATVVQIPVRVWISYALAGRLGLNAVALAVGVGWICMALYQRYEYGKCTLPRLERVSQRG